jgi:2-polyprenyl-6-hydroxyphenyl methylase/3-demethylubiquinone-9 3-methyltransferase
MTETDTTANADDIAQFTALSDQWWDAQGPFAPLHKLSPVRLGIIRDRLATHFDRDTKAASPFAGLSVLDVGCGGGLLCEPMTRLGAKVTGIDAGAENIAAARDHADRVGLDIDYRAISVQEVAANGERFDIILNMEVVEHVADVSGFLAATTACLAPGGMMFTATLNRTAKSFALAIIGAEYVLRWLPRGTHQWSRFLRPAELIDHLGKCGLAIDEAIGVSYSPITDSWFEAKDLAVNYVVVAHRPD